MPTPHAGLRQRKKAQTRRLIAETAMSLFAARGFDRVTVAEVAAAAEVATTTVFNYFPTKEDLFYDRQDEVVGHLGHVVRHRAPGESFVAACRRDMLELIAARDWRAGLAGNIARFHRMVGDSPALQARARLMTDQAVADLATAVAEELGIGADDIVAITTAATLTAIRTSLLTQARSESLAGDDIDTIALALTTATERAFGLLDGDLTLLGTRKRPT